MGMTPRPDPQFGIDFRRARAGDIYEHGLFVWQGCIYLVIKKDPGENDMIAGRIMVKRIASGWTMNPHDRWQGGIDYAAEPFQADCPVMELVYDQGSANQPI